MAIRPDISDYLIHFTKGNTDDEALNNLYSIIKNRKILASNNLIKGGFKVVCFTEAPRIKDGLVNPNNYSKYSPFGIMFKKQWIFKNGGRPVIYQSDQEFELFSDEIKWRHVRYEPHLENPIDFSWEREWRIKCDSLNVMPANASIIVPSKFWAEHIRNIHDYEEDMKVLQYSVVDELLAEFAREEFIWQFYALDQ